MSQEGVQGTDGGERPVPRRAVLVVNARSRNGRHLFQEAERKLRLAGIELIAAHPLKNPKLLVPTVKRAVREGAPMVIVGGGDGSLSQAVDELVDRDCVFALLPLGTANSFARTLGIPVDLDGAIATIAGGRRRRVDLGRVNGDYFANSAAMGVSPMIGDSVPQAMKDHLGRFGYLIWAAWCMIKFRPFLLRIDVDGQRETLRALEVRIANGSFHGGVEVVGEAEVDSGEIVVQAVTGSTKLRLLWDWLAILTGRSRRRETTREFHGRRISIETRPRLRVSIDGEVLTRTPAVVEVAEKAIEVVVPA